MNRVGTKGRARHRPAAILVGVLLCVLVTALLAGSIMHGLALDHRRGQNFERTLQSMWLAESGFRRALARLSGEDEYVGERWELTAESIGRRWPAIVVIQVQPDADAPELLRIIVESHYPSSPELRILHRIETSIPASRKGESQ